MQRKFEDCKSLDPKVHWKMNKSKLDVNPFILLRLYLQHLLRGLPRYSYDMEKQPPRLKNNVHNLATLKLIQLNTCQPYCQQYFIPNFILRIMNLNHDIGSIAQPVPVSYKTNLSGHCCLQLLKGNNTFTSFHGNNEHLRERTSKILLWFLVDRIFYCVNRMEKLRFKVA